MRKDAAANRARILAAAQEIFAEHGFDASTEDIAARAGVGIATVFRHYPTKRDLAEDVMHTRFDEVLARARAAQEAPDATAALLTLVVELVEFVADKRVMLVDRRDGQNWAGLAKNASEELHIEIDQLLRRTQAMGTIRPDLDTDALSLLIQGLGQPAVLAADHVSARNKALNVVLDGLRVTSQT